MEYFLMNGIHLYNILHACSTSVIHEIKKNIDAFNIVSILPLVQKVQKFSTVT